MAIPDYESIMLPLLKYLTDNEEHSLREAIESMARHFGLTPDERNELLPSGRQAVFDNRVGWARTYMKKAGLVESTRRAHFRITDGGRKVLGDKPASITNKYLDQFDEFRTFRALRHEKKPQVAGGGSPVEAVNTPEEALESAYESVRADLGAEMLEQLKKSPPGMFEKTVVELLVKMGYGGSLKDAGEAIGRSGDEGIDGMIKEDRLGLDAIYIQAKRWDNTVGRPEVQKFAGALQGQRARKGIFITTSDFTKEARDYASRIDSRIILVDGKQLCQYMIECNVGVTPVSTYEIKKIDYDFFAEG